MVTSAVVSGRRNARCPNAVMKALPLPAVSVGAFAGTRRASAVASPVTLSASFSEASNSWERSCSVTYKSSAMSSKPISASPETLLSMSEISVSFRRSRTAFDHCGRLSRAIRDVATITAAGGEVGIA